MNVADGQQTARTYVDLLLLFRQHVDLALDSDGASAGAGVSASARAAVGAFTLARTEFASAPVQVLDAMPFEFEHLAGSFVFVFAPAGGLRDGLPVSDRAAEPAWASARGFTPMKHAGFESSYRKRKDNTMSYRAYRTGARVGRVYLVHVVRVAHAPTAGRVPKHRDAARVGRTRAPRTPARAVALAEPVAPGAPTAAAKPNATAGANLTAAPSAPLRARGHARAATARKQIARHAADSAGAALQRARTPELPPLAPGASGETAPHAPSLNPRAPAAALMERATAMPSRKRTFAMADLADLAEVSAACALPVRKRSATLTRGARTSAYFDLLGDPCEISAANSRSTSFLLETGGSLDSALAAAGGALLAFSQSQMSPCVLGGADAGDKPSQSPAAPFVSPRMFLSAELGGYASPGIVQRQAFPSESSVPPTVAAAEASQQLKSSESALEPAEMDGGAAFRTNVTDELKPLFDFLRAHAATAGGPMAIS